MNYHYHLLQYFGGKTKGPKRYCGEIGIKLESYVKMPIINFEKMETTLPEFAFDELVQIDGISTKSVLHFKLKYFCGLITKMTNSRWLTTANKVLRFNKICIAELENNNRVSYYTWA